MEPRWAIQRVRREKQKRTDCSSSKIISRSRSAESSCTVLDSIKIGLPGLFAKTNGGTRERCSKVGQRLPNILTRMICRWGAHSFDHSQQPSTCSDLQGHVGFWGGATSERSVHRSTGLEKFPRACWQKRNASYASLAGSNAEWGLSYGAQNGSQGPILCAICAF